MQLIALGMSPVIKYAPRVSDALFDLCTCNDIKIFPQGEVAFDVDLRVKKSSEDSPGSLHIHPSLYLSFYDCNGNKIEIIKPLVGEENLYKKWTTLKVLMTNNTNEEFEIKNNTMVANLGIFDLDYSHKNGDEFHLS